MHAAVEERSEPSRDQTSQVGSFPSDTVVLGIGNVLLSDDGIGVLVAERLRNSLPADATHKIVDGGTMSHALLPLIQDTEKLIVIDAGQLGCQPGAVRIFENDAIDRYLERSGARTVHEVSLGDLLTMARLTDALPRRRALVVIQPLRIDWGSTPTREVREAIPIAARKVQELMEAWS